MHELRKKAWELYKSVSDDNDFKAMRELCQTDLFYLLVVACKRIDVDRDWLFDRCREVEASPDGYIDLWSREHYKSSIITFGKTIQDILINPEITVGIFSHTRPIAKAFLIQIKRELEQNLFLQELFSDILWGNPQKDSPKWSLDEGIIVKRQGNPKESTVEAWGLVDGQPTSKHYMLMVYDDVVTRESVTTPDMIAKVTESFALSLNLAAEGGAKRFIGTRYHANDTYKTIIDRGTAIPRIYPATDDGTMTGKPVLFSQETFDEKVKDMGSFVSACQLLQNPLQDNAMGFKSEWLEYYIKLKAERYNVYILVDSASEKKKVNDYTVMIVLGLGADQNYYLIDAVRDRMNLTERTNKLFEFVRKYRPLNVGYEKYGLMSDVEHIRYVQEQEGYRFKISELGGQSPKNDRIRRLVPLFEQHRFYFPHFLKYMDLQNKPHDFIHEFIADEYECFPVSIHDDMLDCLSRICDKTDDFIPRFPLVESKVENKQYNPLDTKIQQPQYNPLGLARM